jgi:flagellar basal-body rod protein FlgG
MMNALYTAGSGMVAQQMNVDTISNNLANVNTTSYKKDRVEFKDLLYNTLDQASVLNGKGKPVNLQVGHGTTYVATKKDFAAGNPEKTDDPLDFDIDGPGFFKVTGPNNTTVYTRDGSFKISVTDQGNQLTTSEGYAVLDQNDSPIYLTIDPEKLSVSASGELNYIDADGVIQSLGQSIGVVQFPNPSGLLALGSNIYSKTSASGEPVADSEQTDKSVLMQRFLEASNVQVVEEMVKLIVAQRAYEINSKAIQSADEMLGMANNLKR